MFVLKKMINHKMLHFRNLKFNENFFGTDEDITFQRGQVSS